MLSFHLKIPPSLSFTNLLAWIFTLLRKLRTCSRKARTWDLIKKHPKMAAGCHSRHAVFYTEAMREKISFWATILTLLNSWMKLSGVLRLVGDVFHEVFQTTVEEKEPTRHFFRWNFVPALNLMYWKWFDFKIILIYR